MTGLRTSGGRLPAAARRLGWTGALLALLALAAPANAAASPDVRRTATLGERLGGTVETSPLAATTSVYVWDQQSREVIYTHEASRRVAPASTMKLLTSAAALATLGPDHRFTTRVMLTGRQEGERWIGSVWLVGGGDPTLSTSGFARDNYRGAGANIARLVDPLRARGIRHVSGRLYVVDDHLDEQRYVAEWPSRFRYEEAGALGGLVVNQSQLGRWVGSRSARTPDLRAGAVYRWLLARDGIVVRGGTIAASLPATAIPAGEVSSPPLHVLLRHMNGMSDNFYAEMLLKHVGRETFGPGRGSTADGRLAARASLQRLGVDVTTLRWVDGSGLSYGNRVTARLLGHVLGVGAQAPWGSQWIASFAQSGRPGTLRRRMRAWPYRDRVRGKTGTLRHVSALAGFADRVDSGRRHGFVAVTWFGSGGQVPYTTARRLQDRIAMTLVS